MIFNPRSNNNQDHNQDSSNSGPLPYLNVPYHLPYSELQTSCGIDEWSHNLTLEDNTRSTMNSLNMSNISVSYDIYGNELLLEDEEIPRLNPSSQRDLGLESIEEEEIITADPTVVNQENKDPILHMITPVKRRSQQQQDFPSERRSVVVNRSPLLDITPGAARRKHSHQIDTRMERSFLSTNMTPKGEKSLAGDTSFTRKFR